MRLESGALGRAAVPSGASTGVHEAVELRDGGAAFGGKGVDAGGRERQRRDRVAGRRHRRGRPGGARRRADRARRHAEQGPARRQRDPRRLARRREGARGGGGRLALPRTSAARRRATLPVPMMNVINGGVHAQNTIDLQEFMVVPAGASTFAEALQIGAEVYHALARRAARARASRRRSATRAASRPTCRRARRRSRRSSRRPTAPGVRDRVAIALDPATTEVYRDGAYRFEGRELVGRRAARGSGPGSRRRYPVVSIEDGAAEDDWDDVEAADGASSATACSSSATTSSSRTRSACAAASTRASATRSSSR